jgi:hypothetical protein
VAVDLIGPDLRRDREITSHIADQRFATAVNDNVDGGVHIHVQVNVKEVQLAVPRASMAWSATWQPR